MTVAKQYGRIRVGARIFQDHHFGKWPYCVAPRGSRDEWEADDPDMLFEVRRIERGSDGVCWDCTAHGYGVIGKPDSYGNGGITVSGEDGVELVKHSIPTETEMAQALGLVKRRETSKCSEAPRTSR